MISWLDIAVLTVPPLIYAAFLLNPRNWAPRQERSRSRWAANSDHDLEELWGTDPFQWPAGFKIMVEEATREEAWCHVRALCCALRPPEARAPETLEEGLRTLTEITAPGWRWKMVRNYYPSVYDGRKRYRIWVVGDY